MKWSNLPVAGGMYDQDPDLLDQFRYIFSERNKQQEKEHRKQEAESRGGKAGQGRSARGSRRR